MKKTLYTLCGVAFALCLFGCSSSDQESRIIAESKKVNDFFDRIFDEAVDRYPEWQTYQGIKKDYGKWSDRSEEMSLRSREIDKVNFEWLESSIDYDLLDAQTKVSYRMWVEGYHDDVKNFKYRNYNYPVNQMFGRHTGVPSFLINMHLIADKSDAEAYISRLSSMDYVFDQLLVGLKAREEIGIVPPKFVYPRSIESCRNIITGAPFDDSGEDSALLADFTKKVTDLEIEEDEKAQLIEAASAALVDVVKPAYEGLITFLEVQHDRADTDEVFGNSTMVKPSIMKRCV